MMADVQDLKINIADNTMKQWLDEKVSKSFEFDSLVNALAMYAMKRGGQKGTNLIAFVDGRYHVRTPNGSKNFDNPREALDYLFQDL